MRITPSIVAVLLCIIAGCRSTSRWPWEQFTCPPSTLSQPSTLPSTTGNDPVWPLREPSGATRLPETSTSDVLPAGFVQPETLPIPAPLEAGPEPSAGESGELTLAQLEEIALATNPTLGEAQARLDAAHGRWIQAGLPPNTVLGYSGQQLGSRGLAEQNGVFLSQELVRGGKLRLSRAAADQEIAIAERQLESQRRRVLTDVQLGYYEVLVAQRRLHLSEQMVQISEEASKAADALLRAKEVSRADVLRARVELQANQMALKISRNQSLAAWSRLTAVLGTPDFPPQTLAGQLDKPAVELSQIAIVERLLADSPELHAALYNVERSRWAIARARAEGIPNLDVQGILQQDNSTGSSNGNLQVSMPIPWLNYNQGGIREAQAKLVAAELAVGRVELHLQRRLATVFQRYASARDQVQDYSKQGGILENAKATLELVREGYQAGQFGYLDMLTAQRTFAQTNLAYVEAIGELWAAIIEIEGLLLKDSLDSAIGSP